ncbi:hypothetical protein ACFOUP_15710 [Belliella kenyensis]|uniref:Lipocalin-like domain-containing protein n=1 Tax=Belliella kenyensis TaxID=1472724 RepID=A0ABV8EQ90_9BACT|nr:hypothetical protein [Belliella kenyensis]MCH7401995.1 hypothetical protein [Belliella kenyensis]MDN3605159.1 hypothetical protein [Belliella kenyensis]
MRNILLVFSIFTLLASCIENEGDIQEKGQFPVGNWTIGENHENGFSLIRTENLPDNTFGFSFFENGEMTSRRISGWCGTPPVAYSDYSGTWSIGGTTLKLNMGFWGGRNIQEWKIISSNDSGNVVRIEILNAETVID